MNAGVGAGAECAITAEFHDWEDIRAELDDGDHEAMAAERARTEAWVGSPYLLGGSDLTDAGAMGGARR